jgi:Uri superfamily endonuclease
VKRGTIAGRALPELLDSAECHTCAETLPRAPGAYALLIELAEPLDVRLRGQPAISLTPGRYLYCGSAYGPGGLRARIGRHMRRDKAQRWHVDQLTGAGDVTGAFVFPGGNECSLVAALAELPIAIPGFGSSDCRSCASHLLALPVRQPP